ncbi:conjugative transposon protein TraN [Flavobacterium album]|uniref:Conjugative transposon protein TraN n=1 Tax=Flavobacterium album TaxID=2175091 RepID=A0A2S1R0S1_9FLAO|nr:conjugative transposon protein TraN [Flavobacterium album]AWH86270.1 conjugative transposon protein TraN [Flavobacterium album]
MKKLLSITATLLALLGGPCASHAQNFENGITSLEMGRLEAFEMQVTYGKTTHVIFPTAIRYVDLGSDNLAAGKAEDAGNVLRIKASRPGFEEETNFSVITDDGRFYAFNVCYSQQPQVLSYDLLKMRSALGQAASERVLFEDLADSPPSLAGLLMQVIHTRDRRTLKHLASKSYGITFAVKGIYTHGGKFYFHTELQNSTGIPFRTDFMTFRVADKKVGRRAVAQDRVLVPLRSYMPLDDVGTRSKKANVFLLDYFTLSQEKELVVEVFEKYGNRNQSIHVGFSDLLKAQALDGLKLKY